MSYKEIPKDLTLQEMIALAEKIDDWKAIRENKIKKSLGHYYHRSSEYEGEIGNLTINVYMKEFLEEKEDTYYNPGKFRMYKGNEYEIEATTRHGFFEKLKVLGYKKFETPNSWEDCDDKGLKLIREIRTKREQLPKKGFLEYARSLLK